MGAYADLFQSTPGQLAGRCSARCPAPSWVNSFNPRPANWPGDAPRTPRRPWRRPCFNPRPANWPGDAVIPGGINIRPLRVSIHARPIGRAMLHFTAPCCQDRQVSIHARPIGRAMLHTLTRCAYRNAVSIHARPIGRAMLRTLLQFDRSIKFQSTPGQLAGRCANQPTALARV